MVIGSGVAGLCAGGAARRRVATPDAPYRLTVAELVGWGGMNNAAHRPAERAAGAGFC